jgi:GNAT superfamily N-acetyltransferase
MDRTSEISTPVESYTDSTRACAAFWVPPGGYVPDRDALAAMAPIIEILGDANERFRAAEELMRRHRPADVHFYLQGLGTDPPRQGLGLGVAVLQPVLARCDRDGLPAYLETTKARNVGFYERRGFTVVGEANIPLGGPPMWFMLREPR